MTPKQLFFVRKLMIHEGLSFAEEDYAAIFSDGRTNVLSELTHQETQALIGEFATPTPAVKMRRKILSMAHEMRWETKNGKVDFAKLDDWCVKHTPSHTNFNGISVNDLPIVVSIYEKMYNQFLKQL